MCVVIVVIGPRETFFFISGEAGRALYTLGYICTSAQWIVYTHTHYCMYKT